MTENPWPNGVPELMPAEDRAEIEELFARYAWGIDLADEEQAIATFAEDAEFDHLWQGKVRGHAATAPCRCARPTSPSRRTRARSTNRPGMGGRGCGPADRTSANDPLRTMAPSPYEVGIPCRQPLSEDSTKVIAAARLFASASRTWLIRCSRVSIEIAT